MIKCILSKGDDPTKQISECLSTINEMEILHKKEKEIVLDLSEIKWILPCSALLLSSKIISLLKKDSKITYIKPSKESVKDYLKEIGFPLGTKINGGTYSPIKHFGKNEDINREISQLLKSMRKKTLDSFGGSIQYIFGELADNIAEHSRFSNATIMAQYYPKKQYIDIGVLDDGLSIPYVFEKHNIKFVKDSDAINLALTGTTTKKDDGTRGFGLRSTKELVKEALNGELYIVSRKGVRIISPKSKDKIHNFNRTSLKGTLLYMRLNTPKKHLNIYPHLE